MAVVGNDFTSQALRRLLQVKGATANNLIEDLVPTIQSLDLERSPQPPWYRWRTYSAVGAVAAQYGYGGVVFDLVGLPSESRVIVDRVRIQTGTTGKIWLALYNANVPATIGGGPLLTKAAVAVHGVQQAAGEPILAAVRGFEGNTATDINGPNATPIWGDNFLGPHAEDYAVGYILAPGQSLYLRTDALNEAMNLTFEGRLFW